MTNAANQNLEGDALVAVLTAAAAAVLGANVRILNVQCTEEFSKYGGWVQYARIQQFQIVRSR
jgi:hypothetical protein